MSEKRQFLKIPVGVISEGFWAQMTPAARALYPVLLKYSDGHYCSVWPGSGVLLKLTGFKQKSSIKKAREELRNLGLLSYTPGSGRTNTRYHFQFPWESAHAPQGSSETPPWGIRQERPGPPEKPSEYNQIQISINNNVNNNQETQNDKSKSTNKDYKSLISQFGESSVTKAIRECELSNLPVIHENLEKILFQTNQVNEWDQILLYLESIVTPGSCEMLKRYFIQEQAGVLFFSDCLPEHLRVMLKKTASNMQIVFEPEMDSLKPVLLANQGRL